MLPHRSRFWPCAVFVNKTCLLYDDCAFTFMGGVSTMHGRGILPNALRRIKFSPSRQPGVHVGAALRSDACRFSRVLDFCFCFFASEVIRTLCENTNKYAGMHTLDRPTYSRREGSWDEVTLLEMVRLIGAAIIPECKGPQRHCSHSLW